MTPTDADTCLALRRQAHLPITESGCAACPLWHRCPQQSGQRPPLWLTGRYAALSNWAPAGVELTEGLVVYTYPTVVHAFQAQRTLSLIWRERIRRCPTPAEACRIGHKAPSVRRDWQSKQLAVMADLLARKFQQPDLAALLRSTGDAVLLAPGDTYWGVDRQTGLGLNQAGRLLMQLRASL